ncbi:hypothetical protein CL655_03945 [bacterium]|nr:hypothetical protein [bacterium]|tara:strand:- start:437 stop:1831 length:1395 start_codon:yes stop_codon:yes gene_type:complete
MKKDKNILLFVGTFADRYANYIAQYEAKYEKHFRTMLLRDSKLRKLEKEPTCDIFVECDFSKPHKIAEVLLPYQDELLAVTCRTEQQIARFAQVIPHVPYLRTPTTESLAWAADKYEMRKRFNLGAKKYNPRFTWVKNATASERRRVIEKVGFPLVIKPTSLAGSLFVSICYHEDELHKTLQSSFRRVRAAYKKDSRLEEPKIIAEEYIEGELYSIDSYVNSRGAVYHCPLVRQRTARERGGDDLYNYLQITPTALKSTTIAKAEEVAEAAIHALGLRSVTAHTELIKHDDEWKIVEVGPRPGGQRDLLHSLSCDINHTMNDLLVRIPRKPVIPKKCQGFAAYLKYYAQREGEITETKGIKKIEELDSFNSIVVNKRVGDRAIFARNGGRSIFNVVLYNNDRAKLLADIRRIEQMVSVRVLTRGKKAHATKKAGVTTNQKKATIKTTVKKVAKKTVKRKSAKKK